MTSAPSVTDIGFSGMRRANSTSADQPVASAIGISGTSARSPAAEGGEQHERDGEQAGEQGQQAPPGRGHGGVGLGGEHRQPGEVGPHARRAGGVRRRIVLEHVVLAVQRHQPDAEGQRRACGGPGVITPCEKYGGTASSSAVDLLARAGCLASLNRSGSENAGQTSAAPQPRFSL